MKHLSSHGAETLSRFLKTVSRYGQSLLEAIESRSGQAQPKPTQPRKPSYRMIARNTEVRGLDDIFTAPVQGIFDDMPLAAPATTQPVLPKPAVQASVQPPMQPTLRQPARPITAQPPKPAIQPTVQPTPKPVVQPMDQAQPIAQPNAPATTPAPVRQPVSPPQKPAAAKPVPPVMPRRKPNLNPDYELNGITFDIIVDGNRQLNQRINNLVDGYFDRASREADSEAIF